MYLKDKKIEKFSFSTVTVEDVVKIVHDLKSMGATGPDGVSVILLKKIIYNVAVFITVVVNTVIKEARYPTLCRYGIITPVPKPGDPLEAKSWRPVTILCAASKVVEIVLNNQLQHLKTNKLLSQEQHAYQAGKLTQTAWMSQCQP